MTRPSLPACLLAEYDARFTPRQVAYLASAGGMSGARLWRLETAAGPYLVRQWPQEYPTPERLVWIHRVIRFVSQAGFPLVAPPELTREWTSSVEHDGHLWELARWLPGEANWAAEPSEAKLAAAMQALAQFHQASAAMPGETQHAATDSLYVRLWRVVAYRNGEFEQLWQRSRQEPEPWPGAAAWRTQFGEVARLQLAALERMLTPVAAVSVPMQPCLGDIWHENVLFATSATGSAEVTGLIDYSAVRIDCVAIDVARLLGGMAKNDHRLWNTGLAAYEAVRPLAEQERLLVQVYDRSGVILSGLNWLRWLFVERRFADAAPRAQARLSYLLERALAL